jgi:hypothetical protein
MKIFFQSILSMVIAASLQAAPSTSYDQFIADHKVANRAEKSAAGQRRLDWWRDARFGMFIHWDPSIGAKLLKAALMNGTAVDVAQSSDGIRIGVKPEDRDPVATTIALESDRDTLGLPAMNAP